MPNPPIRTVELPDCCGNCVYRRKVRTHYRHVLFCNRPWWDASQYGTVVQFNNVCGNHQRREDDDA